MRNSIGTRRYGASDDRDNGTAVGARDLTWSYVAFQTATERRQTVLNFNVSSNGNNTAGGNATSNSGSGSAKSDAGKVSVGLLGATIFALVVGFSFAI